MLRRVLIAAAPATAVTTWDPVVKAAEVVLSNGNMDAEVPGSTSWRTAVATNGKASGKWQYEAIGFVGNVIVGVTDRGNLANLLGQYLGSSVGGPEKIGYFGSGTIYRNLSSGVGNSPATAYAVGDVITVTLDADSAAVSFYKNGVFVATRALPVGKTWWPAASVELGKRVRIRPVSLQYPVSGYSEWS